MTISGLSDAFGRVSLSLGAMVTVTEKTPGAYDAAGGTVSVTSSAKTVKAILGAVKVEEDERGAVVGYRRRLWVEAGVLSREPRPDDTVTIGSAVWTVKAAKSLQPHASIVQCTLGRE